MATIEDVAKLAGVSAMTVSRHINKSGYVSQKTGGKIENAISTLGFRANIVAKSLVTKKTNTLGLIIASIADPFYPDLVLGVEDEAYSRGYNVILCNADGKKKENEYIEILHDRYVDGIIFSHLNIDIKQVLVLKDMDIGSVLIDNEIDGLDTGYVKTNEILGGFLATEHLIGLGHKKIALIHGSLFFDELKVNRRYAETYQFKIWNNRMKGYLEAMKKYGVSVNPNFIVNGNEFAKDEVESGYIAMKKIFAMNDRPTAVYAQNDLMAIGAINAVYELGYSVPQDFSIIGHDGIPIGDMIYPKLTTIDQPRYDIGRSAAGMLIDIVNNIDRKILQLDPKLIDKGSTRKL